VSKKNEPSYQDRVFLGHEAVYARIESGEVKDVHAEMQRVNFEESGKDKK
jgi:hypothetical protein